VDDRLALLAGGNVRVFDSAGNGVVDIRSATRPAWSLDGDRIAAVRLEGALGVPIIVDVSTGSETPLFPAIEPHAPDYPIAWHPDGQLIAYRDRLYDAAAGTERQLPGVAISFSSHGRMLLVTLPDDPARGTVIGRLLDLNQDLKPVIGLEIPGPGQTPGWIFIQKFVTWTADGRYLMYMDPTVSRERVRVYDTVDIRQTPYTNIRGDRPVSSPDSVAIVFQDMGMLYVLKVDGTRFNRAAEGTQGEWVK
jgi:hypothetical protein